MSDLEVVLTALSDLEGAVVRDVESINRKLQALELERAEVLAVAKCYRQNISNADFLPHTSIRRQFGRNEVRDYCLRALAGSGGALDTRQLASFVIDQKGLDDLDSPLRKKIVFSVMQAMKTARRHRYVIDDGRRQGVRLWRLGQHSPTGLRSKGSRHNGT